MTVDRLREWLAKPREDLTRALERAVEAHVQELLARGHEFYGYALSFGLEPELAAPIAITNRVDDLPADRPQELDYYRYAVNEWKHWWEGAGAYAEATALTNRYQARFAELHAPVSDDPESLVFSSWEQRHQEAHQQAVLDALESAKQAGVFAPDHFIQIYISGSHWDSGLSIVERSVRLLNTTEHVERYVQELG